MCKKLVPSVNRPSACACSQREVMSTWPSACAPRGKWPSSSEREVKLSKTTSQAQRVRYNLERTSSTICDA
eukprot:1891260-Pleurochrysis_carterae.AAC.2